MRLQPSHCLGDRGLDAYFSPPYAVQSLIAIEGGRIPRRLWEPAAQSLAPAQRQGERRATIEPAVDKISRESAAERRRDGSQSGEGCGGHGLIVNSARSPQSKRGPLENAKADCGQ